MLSQPWISCLTFGGNSLLACLSSGPITWSVLRPDAAARWIGLLGDAEKHPDLPAHPFAETPQERLGRGGRDKEYDLEVRLHDDGRGGCVPSFSVSLAVAGEPEDPPPDVRESKARRCLLLLSPLPRRPGTGGTAR